MNASANWEAKKVPSLILDHIKSGTMMGPPVSQNLSIPRTDNTRVGHRPLVADQRVAQGVTGVGTGVEESDLLENCNLITIFPLVWITSFARL